MSNVIEAPRHFCTLGSQQVVLAIEKAIPILHAGPGCSQKLWEGLSFYNGFQGTGYAGGSAVPCTNATENEVIFGGEQRLREVIEGSLKVMDGELFVVLTGCLPDLIGDDTMRVVREFQERGAPIVYAETGGFKGTTYQGYDIVVEAIVKQFLTADSNQVIPGLVNIWSAVPYQDPFWSGNLQAIKDLLAGIGLEANILFGPQSGGIQAWKKVPAAQFNLVISPWVGLNIAQLLEEEFGTPFLHYPVFPIGATETSRFLREVANFANLETNRIETFISQQEANFFYYLERAADFFLGYRYYLPGHFVTVADSFYALGVSRFLVNDVGLLPGPQFITDETPEEYQAKIVAEFSNLAPKVSAEVRFIADSGVIHDELRKLSHLRQPLILGSDWDRDIAAKLPGYHVGIALPLTDCLILNRSYIGYQGGLRLIEDIYRSVLESW